MARKKATESTDHYLTRAEIAELNALAAQAVCEAVGIEYTGQTMEELSASRRRTQSEPLDLDWFGLSRECPPFFDQAYRLRKSKKRTAHRLGGKRSGKSPRCNGCDSPLVLFVDLDLRRPPFAAEFPIDRLPLYYCTACPGPVYYIVNSTGAVQPVPATEDDGDENPFSKPLPKLPAAYCELIKVPPELERPVFDAIKGEGHKSLTAEQLRQFTRILGRKTAGRWDMYFSQVGSYPISFQGEEGLPVRCPNRSCSHRRRKSANSGFRPLAVLDLWNDRFWGFKRHDALQIVYHICPGCHCISAKYTCT